MNDAMILCHLEEIEDGEGKGFVFGRGLARRELVVVRAGRRIYGYVNACPHQGTPLEMEPDRFMSADGSYLLCRTHGALFQIEDGYCIAGPCAGDALTAIKVWLDDEDRVVLAESALGGA